MTPATFDALRISSADALAASRLTSARLDALVAGHETRAEDAAWAVATAALTGIIALALSVQGTAWLLAAATVAGLGAIFLSDDHELCAWGVGLAALTSLGVVAFRVWHAGWGPLFGACGIGAAAGCVVLGGLRGARALSRRHRGGPLLSALYREIACFNEALELAGVQAELAPLGAAVPVPPSLFDAFRSARGELLRALAIERVMREHAGVLRSDAPRFGSLFPETAGRLRLDASSRVEALTDSLATVAEARLIWERELASARPGRAS